MADGASMTIKGLDQLMADLRALPAVVQSELIKRATAKAASVIRSEARTRAPVYTGEVANGHPPPGTLRDAIYMARVASRCTPSKEVWVINVRQGKGSRKTKRGKKVMNLDAYYAYFVEKGHYVRQAGKQSRGKRKAAQSTGAVRFVPARPFMRPAFEAKKGAAADAFRTYITDNLPIAAKGMRIIKYKP